MTIDQMPEIKSRYLHLAPFPTKNLNLALMRQLKSRGQHAVGGYAELVVRQVDPDTREIAFKDVPEKREDLQSG